MTALFMTLLALLLIPLGSWFDRQRGSSPDVEKISKLPALIGLGLIGSFLVLAPHFNLLEAIIVATTIAGGYNWYGFGQPIGQALTNLVRPADDGSIYEWWQFGPIKKNPWLALTFYGVVLFPLSLLVVTGVFDIIFVIINSVAGQQLSYFDWNWMKPIAIKLAIAHGIAWPIAPAIARHVMGVQAEGSWALQEKLRGAIQTAILAIIFILTTKPF